MPSFVMIPETQSGTNQWSASTGTDFVDIVDESNDITYIYETRATQQINYVMTNPSVAEANIDFNETVTVTPKVNAHHTGSGTIDLELDITGVGLQYGENSQSIANDDSFPVYSFTGVTNQAPGTAWTYNGLKACNVKLTCEEHLARFQTLRVSYIFFKVDYTAVAVANNATFFGANF